MTAFQSTAFQTNAFQSASPTAPTPVFSAAQNGSATSFSLPGSALIQSGDVRIVGATGVFDVDLPAPTGWTRFAKLQVGATTPARWLFLFRRTAEADDSTATTFTFTATTPYAAAQTAVRGVHQTTPIDVGPLHDSADSGTTLTAPSVTTTVADTVLLGLFVLLNETNGNGLSTPSGMTLRASQATVGGVGQSVLLASEARSAAGATGTRVSTSPVDFRWVAAALALRPASAAAATERTVTDPVGVTDAAERASATTVTVTDPVGVTDAATRATTSTRTVTDTAGLVDAATAALTFAAAVTDQVGVTDTPGQVTTSSRTATDVLGPTDAAAAATSLAAAVADPLGLSDTTSPAFTASRDVTDPLGLTDVASAVAALAATLTDTVGVSDAASTAGGYVQGVADPLGLVDTAAASVALAVTLTDQVGMVDGAATGQPPTFAAILTDQVGAVDSAGRTYYTRFTEHPTGAAAPDWAAYGPTPFTQSVTDDTHGERHLRVQKTGSGVGGLTWSKVPPAADVEVFLDVQSNNTTSSLVGRFKAGGRMDAVAVTGYFGGHGQSIQERLIKYTPALALVAESLNGNWAAGTRIRIRLRLTGSTLQVKVWKFGTHEPAAFEVTATDSSLTTAGLVGVFSFGSATVDTDTKVYGFGVGVGGVTATRTHYAAPTWDQIPRPIQFPIPAAGNPVYVDGWRLLRDGGARVHRGTDIYGDFGTPVYAMTAGTVHSVGGGDGVITPGSGGGYSFYINDLDGKVRRSYLHLGPNESGRESEALAPGIEVGTVVAQGQLLGWLGDSGSSASGPHLHTDFRDLAGDVLDDQYADYAALLGSQDAPRFNPYPSLQAASPAPLWLTLTDALGVADTVPRDLARTVVDPVGLVDTAGMVSGHDREAADPVGLVDAPSQAASSSRTSTDPVGATDTSAATVGVTVTLAEPLGVTDTAGQVAATTRAATDPVGVTDAASAGAAVTATLADAVGLTDAADTAVAHAVAVTDPVGSADTSSGAATSSRDATDPVGVVDAASSGAELVATITDTVEIVDTTGQAGTGARTVTDPAGLADATTAAAVTGRSVTDAVGLGDTVGSGTFRTVTITDPVGVVHTSDRAITSTRTVTDTVGVADLPSQVVAADRLIADAVTLTDTATAGTAAAHTRDLVDPLGVTDAASTGTDHARTVADPVGLADLHALTEGRTVTVSDLIGATDLTAEAATHLRSITDSVNAADAASTTGDVASWPPDVIGPFPGPLVAVSGPRTEPLVTVVGPVSEPVLLAALS